MRPDVATLYRFSDGRTIVRPLTKTADLRLRKQVLNQTAFSPRAYKPKIQIDWFMIHPKYGTATTMVTTEEFRGEVTLFHYTTPSESGAERPTHMRSSMNARHTLYRADMPFWRGFLIGEVLRTTHWQDSRYATLRSFPLLTVFIPDAIYEAFSFPPEVMAEIHSSWNFERAMSRFARLMDEEGYVPALQSINVKAEAKAIVQDHGISIETLERLSAGLGRAGHAVRPDGRPTVATLRKLLLEHWPVDPSVCSVSASHARDITFNFDIPGMPPFFVSRGDPSVEENPDDDRWQVWLETDIYVFGDTPLEAMEKAPFFTRLSQKDAWLRDKVVTGEPVVDLSSYHLLGLNPTIWLDDRFGPLWQGLQVDEP